MDKCKLSSFLDVLPLHYLLFASRFLENHDSSFEFNSTACRELRQEIIDVKVLTMWVILTRQANIDLCPQCKVILMQVTKTTNVSSIYNPSPLVIIVFHIVLVICVFTEYWTAEEKYLLVHSNVGLALTWEQRCLRKKERDINMSTFASMQACSPKLTGLSINSSFQGNHCVELVGNQLDGEDTEQPQSAHCWWCTTDTWVSDLGLGENYDFPHLRNSVCFLVRLIMLRVDSRGQSDARLSSSMTVNIVQWPYTLGPCGRET